MDEDNVGLDSHTDLTVTSILHQLNNVDGLEIKLKDGEWISVDASPSIFVVMAGDVLNVSIINEPGLIACNIHFTIGCDLWTPLS